MWKIIKMRLKQIVRNLLPPFLLELYRSPKRRREKKNEIRYEGSYSSWEEAVRNSDGYDSDLILSRTKRALLKVKSGDAVYERDSILFDKIEYSFPMLSVLLRTALANKGTLNVLDFGGALGTTYYQCRKFLSNVEQLRWNIVEQDKTVTCGRELFENDELKFFYNIDECLKFGKPDVVLLSGVIGYIKEPFDFLQRLVSHDFPIIIFDHTIVMDNYPTRLTVQTIPPYIYDISFPCWIVNQEQLLGVFKNRYRLFCEFEAYVGGIIPLSPNVSARNKGYVFELN